MYLINHSGPRHRLHLENTYSISVNVLLLHYRLVFYPAASKLKQMNKQEQKSYCLII